MAAVVGGYAEALIVEWLGSQGSAMLAALREMVDTDGGTYDKAGVDAVGSQVRRFLEAQSIAVETVPRATYGDCLKARVERDGAQASGAGGGGNARRWIVLMGHRDTVFPKGEPERRPFRVEGGRAYGPGVADMKAGLVMNMFVLAAFKRFGGAPAPLLGLFTGDEEIGSPEGREVIEGVAREARAVFNAEPGRPSGGVITGRKGGVFSFFEIEGKAAHSGGNFEAGVSAIEELARKVQALHAITDLKHGITVNVGLVNGGQSVNTVAPYATGQIDLRYVEPQDREEAMARIHDIVGRSFVPGTRAKLSIRGEFLPLTQNPASARLFEGYREAAAASGLDIRGEFSGGCANSGFTAAVGAPTLCATGPVGGKAHSPEEYLEIGTMVPRAQALARAILRIDATGV